MLDMQVPFGAASTDPLGALGATAVRGVQLALVPSSVDALAQYYSQTVVGVLVLALGLALGVASWGRPALAGICAAALILVPNAAAAAQNGLIGDRYYHLTLASLAVGVAVLGGRRRLHPLAWSIPLLLAALTFVRAGDWQNDEKLFMHSLASDPDNPYAAFHVGHDLHIRKGDCPSAVPLYEVGMTVDLRAGTNLLACLLDLRRYEDVLARGPKIAELSPGNPGPPANIARAAQRSGKFELAERWAHEAVDRGRGNAKHFVLLAHILAARGKLDEAAAAYGRALELDPDSEEARAGLAGVTGRVLE